MSGKETVDQDATVTYDKERNEVSTTVPKIETEYSPLVPAEKLVKLHRAALVVSYISVIFALSSGMGALVLSFQGDNESLFAYGLDAVLDSFSSLAVVWRFHGDYDSASSVSRETKACIVIGVLFLVSALSLIIKSTYNIIAMVRESRNYELFITFSSVCAGVSLLIAAGKIYLGLKLHSNALATDSIITLAGVATCLASIVGIMLYSNDRDLWYLDAMFSLICAVFLMAFGIRLLYVMLWRDKEKTLKAIS